MRPSGRGARLTQASNGVLDILRGGVHDMVNLLKRLFRMEEAVQVVGNWGW